MRRQGLMQWSYPTPLLESHEVSRQSGDRTCLLPALAGYDTAWEHSLPLHEAYGGYVLRKMLRSRNRRFDFEDGLLSLFRDGVVPAGTFCHAIRTFL